MVRVASLSVPALRACVLRCAAHLMHAATLAEATAYSEDPLRGAEYIVGGVSETRVDLATLKAAILSRPK